MKLNLYLFLSLFLVGSIAAVLGSDVVKGETENDSDAERMLGGRKRRRKKVTSPVVESDDVKMYTRSYLTIFGSQLVYDNDKTPPFREDFVLGKSVMARGSSDFTINANEKNHFGVIGATMLQAGPIYNPNDVKFIDCSRQRRKDSCEINDQIFNVRLYSPQYGGGKQPNVVQLKPPKNNYFINGKCKTVAGFGDSQTLAQSCFYNLCLGGSLGEDCVNIYAGGGYIFDTQASVGIGEEPLLPPSFPGAVIGGVGLYQGIKGSAQIVTVTTPTSPRNGASLMNRFGAEYAFIQTGYTTQLIQLETTIMLPPSKTLVSDNTN